MLHILSSATLLIDCTKPSCFLLHSCVTEHSALQPLLGSAPEQQLELNKLKEGKGKKGRGPAPGRRMLRQPGQLQEYVTRTSQVAMKWQGWRAAAGIGNQS